MFKNQSIKDNALPSQQTYAMEYMKHQHMDLPPLCDRLLEINQLITANRRSVSHWRVGNQPGGQRPRHCQRINNGGRDDLVVILTMEAPETSKNCKQ
jgi:hypothetical protein